MSIVPFFSIDRVYRYFHHYWLFLDQTDFYHNSFNNANSLRKSIVTECLAVNVRIRCVYSINFPWHMVTTTSTRWCGNLQQKLLPNLLLVVLLISWWFVKISDNFLNWKNIYIFFLNFIYILQNTFQMCRDM